MDEDGESYWVFESRDVSTLLLRFYDQPLTLSLLHSLHAQPTPLTQSMAFLPSRSTTVLSNKLSRMFWTALYVYPVLWALLLIVSILKLNLS